MNKNRYPGIHSFTADEHGQFFGRERETKELYRLLVLNPVVVLFGKSGTGKTSLLQAGLSPLLHERLLQPVKLRLNDNAKPIARQLWEQFNVNEYLPLDTPDDLPLTELCRRFDFSSRGEAMSPVLLLDQFEELFTLYGDQPEQREAFISQLADLVNQHTSEANAKDGSPKVRIVISIRSDFLYLIDRLSTRIPAILRCRYELQPLDETNARQAITAPAALPGNFVSQPFSYSTPALNVILEGLTAQKEATEDGTREVEAFLLQQFCQRIESKLAANDTPSGFIVTSEFFGGKAGIEALRDDFYAKVLAKFNDTATRLKVQRLVEEKLISAERRILSEHETIKRELLLTDSDLALLCAERLLVQEPRGSSFYYEISHDTLLPPILRARKQRLEAEDRKENTRRIRRLTGIVLLLGVVLTGAVTAMAWTLRREAALRRATGQVVQNILKDAADKVRQLQYDEAWDKMGNACQLGVEKTETAQALMEIAYFFNETGHSKKAVTAALQAAQMFERNEMAAALELTDTGEATRQTLRDFLHSLDSARFSKLDSIYYPVMVPIAGGTFLMGRDTMQEKMGDTDEFPPHEVRLSDFEIAQTETTFWQYGLYAAATGQKISDLSPGWGIDGDNPVVKVSWFDACNYANWLSKRFNRDTAYIKIGKTFRLNPNARGTFGLPTEAEWEYAARGGNRPGKTLYAGSDSLNLVAWWHETSSTMGLQRSHAVQKLLPNSLQLFDMSGNVWEWCWDWYGTYPPASPIPIENPQGPLLGNERVLRGGSWHQYEKTVLRLVNRKKFNPDDSDSDSEYGFRLGRHL